MVVSEFQEEIFQKNPSQYSVQFTLVAQSHPTLCNPMNYSGLTEHCDSWIDNFHPSFRFVQSLQLCVWVCACAHIPTPPVLAKDLEPKSDSLQLKRPCWLSHVQPSQEARSSGSLSLWWGCQLPRLTPKPCSEHLGSIMFWSSSCDTSCCVPGTSEHAEFLTQICKLVFVE